MKEQTAQLRSLGCCIQTEKAPSEPGLSVTSGPRPPFCPQAIPARCLPLALQEMGPTLLTAIPKNLHALRQWRWSCARATTGAESLPSRNVFYPRSSLRRGGVVALLQTDKTQHGRWIKHLAQGPSGHAHLHCEPIPNCL